MLYTLKVRVPLRALRSLRGSMTFGLQMRTDSGGEMILVRFTKDMVETLLTFFQAYHRDDVVTLQLTERGLWLVNPHDGTRQFLGQAVLSEVERERLRRARGGLN